MATNAVRAKCEALSVAALPTVGIVQRGRLADAFAPEISKLVTALITSTHYYHRPHPSNFEDCTNRWCVEARAVLKEWQ